MPLRTCLITKQKAEQRALLRFTAQRGKLTFDAPGKPKPGRGGYVLPDVKAIEKIPRMMGKVAHFLRQKAVLEPEEMARIVAYIAEK